MRRALAVVSLLLLPFFSHTAVGADAPAAEARVSDPAADVMIRGSLRAGNLTKSPGDEHVDLRSVWLSNETETTFELGAAVTEWTDPYGQIPDAQRWIVLSFGFGANSYSAIVGKTLGGGFGARCAAEQAEFGPSVGGDYPYVTRIGCLNVTIEADKGLLRVVVEKRLVADHGQRPMAVGAVVNDLHAVAGYYAGYALQAVDRAPDGGTGPSYVLRHGDLQRNGHLVLYTPLPVRASNGESTTMVFPLDVRNEESFEDRVLLRADNTNPDWTVRLPSSVLIPAQGSVRVPLILTMNFTHLHGQTILMPVHAESTHAPGVHATLVLGVHWLEIPQPAGHHDRFWLHSSVRPIGSYPSEVITTSSIWFNALETDPRPQTKDVPVRGDTGNYAVGDIVWTLPLDPLLRIGLDLDSSLQGQLTVQTRHAYASTAATLDADLAYCGRVQGGQGDGANECYWTGNMTVLLEGRAGPRSVSPNTVVAWEVPLTVQPDRTFHPFQPSSNLVLRIRLHEDIPHHIYEEAVYPVPELVVKGAQLQLPLREYHDPIDQSFERVGTLRLRALDPMDKLANPGRTAVFRYEVQNSGNESIDARLTVEGINEDWARVHEGGRAVLGPGESRTVSVVVGVPADAAAGERAELFFLVEDEDAPHIAALARLRLAVVDPAMKDIADEAVAAALDEEGASSPSGALVLLAFVVGIGLALRRRSP